MVPFPLAQDESLCKVMGMTTTNLLGTYSNGTILRSEVPLLRWQESEIFSYFLKSNKEGTEPSFITIVVANRKGWGAKGMEELIPWSCQTC
jgi:hypothetical protein